MVKLTSVVGFVCEKLHLEAREGIWNSKLVSTSARLAVREVMVATVDLSVFFMV